MPHSNSAKKRLRQNKRLRLHNRAVKSDLRSQIKRLLTAVKEDRKEEANQHLRLVYKKLDKCATRRYLHPNTACRYKSRLTRKVNAMGSADGA